MEGLDLNILDWIVQAGIPAALGVIIVFYLLRYHIPRLETTFSETMKAQMTASQESNKGFQEAMKQQATECKEMVTSVTSDHKTALEGLTETIREQGKAAAEQRKLEGERTRATLHDLSQCSEKLTEAVFKLYGKEIKESVPS